MPSTPPIPPLELSDSDRRSVARLGAADGLEEGPTIPREQGRRAVAAALRVIEDVGTTGMGPEPGAAADPEIVIDPRGRGVAIDEEPSHEGDTARLRVGTPMGPALPFRAVAEAHEGNGAVGAYRGSRSREATADSTGAPEVPEAYTVELRRPPRAEPALPFAPRRDSPGRAPEPAAALPPSSRWATNAELDPSELPSAQLAEIAAASRTEPRPPRRPPRRLAMVLGLWAIVVVALLALAAVLRW